MQRYLQMRKSGDSHLLSDCTDSYNSLSCRTWRLGWSSQKCTCRVVAYGQRHSLELCSCCHIVRSGHTVEQNKTNSYIVLYIVGIDWRTSITSIPPGKLLLGKVQSRGRWPVHLRWIRLPTSISIASSINVCDNSVILGGDAVQWINVEDGAESSLQSTWFTTETIVPMKDTHRIKWQFMFAISGCWSVDNCGQSEN